MEELLMGIIDKFNQRAETDEKLRQELEGITRSVQIQVTDGKDYNFVLDNMRIENFTEGNIDSPDITIISDTKTIYGLFNRDIGPMKALATSKLKVKGSLSDMLKIRKLF